MLVFLRSLPDHLWMNLQGKEVFYMKNKKIIIVFALVFALLIVSAVTVYVFANSNDADNKYAKTITVLVVVEGRDTKTFTIGTDAEFLLDALNQIELVEGSESIYGFFITTVDGITANENKQEWWAVSKDGEQTLTGVSSTPIKDGDTFELTLSTY
ncbi:MAG: hypothetical protein CVU97_00380 [Firmicutes bacterium HGW-Firmicutes-21]|nr:MAG: hypothetical protein CVU97_00380 [Firmicutes bacterium HGW-Firmicutes-21]